jgi:hypothetical protein
VTFEPNVIVLTHSDAMLAAWKKQGQQQERALN